MRAVRSACASCAPRSTSSRATGTSAPERSGARRTGILGGTFNPPHVGHLLCASEAIAQLGLDRVLVVPTRVAPHKEVDDDPGAEIRLELCRAATDGDDRLAVSRLELDRAGPSWSVDTLREIHAADPEHELTFIVGGDQARGLPSWREPEAVLGLASVAVAERAEVGRDDVLRALSGLRGATQRVRFFAMPRLDISSTDVRRRVREGRPIRYLVPAAVEALVRDRGLYGAVPIRAGKLSA